MDSNRGCCIYIIQACVLTTIPPGYLYILSWIGFLCQNLVLKSSDYIMPVLTNYHKASDTQRTRGRIIFQNRSTGSLWVLKQNIMKLSCGVCIMHWTWWTLKHKRCIHTEWQEKGEINQGPKRVMQTVDLIWRQAGATCSLISSGFIKDQRSNLVQGTWVFWKHRV